MQHGNIYLQNFVRIAIFDACLLTAHQEPVGKGESALKTARETVK
jgi:hypothetical protein